MDPKTEIHYPDSDGQPIADNTLQFEWIATIMCNASFLYREDANVFIAADHLIYPIPGDMATRMAPDVYIAFGRPNHHRGSYKVWEEGNIFPQVVIEVWSPGNTASDRDAKLAFYGQHGAEEFYILYPEFPATIHGWIRQASELVPLDTTHDFVSPRLGWKFFSRAGDIAVIGPDGREFQSPKEVARQRYEAELVAEEQKRLAVKEQVRADQEQARADEYADIAITQSQIAKQQTELARQKTEEAEQQTELARQKVEEAERLREKLRALGIDPDAV
jgi:Uma2 family endonuclease